jgi:CMP-N-acetylneuraminic acid synthetase
VPGKNLKPFRGKPLIMHTVDAARAAKSIDHVYVTTDDVEIVEMVDEVARVIMRPPEMATDTAQIEPALLHALGQIRLSKEVDCIVMLQPTSPLRTAVHIDGAVAKAQEYDCLFSACEVRGFVWHIRKGVPVTWAYSMYDRPRSQDRDPVVQENGAVYVLKPWVLEKLGARLGGKIGVYMMSVMDSLEVDTYADFQ